MGELSGKYILVVDGLDKKNCSAYIYKEDGDLSFNGYMIDMVTLLEDYGVDRSEMAIALEEINMYNRNMAIFDVNGILTITKGVVNV